MSVALKISIAEDNPDDTEIALLELRTIGEETAVLAIKNGATDYLMKDFCGAPLGHAVRPACHPTASDMDNELETLDQARAPYALT